MSSPNLTINSKFDTNENALILNRVNMQMGVADIRVTVSGPLAEPALNGISNYFAIDFNFNAGLGA